MAHNLSFVNDNFDQIFFPDEKPNELKPIRPALTPEQLDEIKEWGSIHQFNDGTLWVLNRLPVEVEITEVTNGDETLKLSKAQDPRAAKQDFTRLFNQTFHLISDDN